MAFIQLEKNGGNIAESLNCVFLSVGFLFESFQHSFSSLREEGDKESRCQFHDLPVLDLLFSTAQPNLHGFSL